MSIFKTKNSKGRYHNQDARQKLIRYIMNPQKTVHGLVGFCYVDPNDPASSMDHVAQDSKRTTGVQLRHFIFSFAPNEPVSPALAACIGERIITYFGQRFQGVYAVHEDTPHLHIHVVINSVSFTGGFSYRGTRQEWHHFNEMLKTVFAEYGLVAPRYVKADDPIDEYE